jgi:5-carboxymethyl-2-hydroxymuconate isomerase
MLDNADAMPHLTIECSANVVDATDVGALTDALHDAVLSTGLVRLDALRTRAAVREHYAVGDRAPRNMFVAVTVRLAPGRSAGDKRRLMHVLMDALDEQLGAARATAMLSVELQEIDPVFRLNRNHLRSTTAET